MSVFFTDSNCEIWYDKLDKLNIKYISMPYSLDGVEHGYDLGKTFDFKAFFDALKQGKNATTMALNPANYVEIFEPYLKQGEDIIYVHFSSNLSGTFNHLELAKKELLEKYPERKITTVDTLNISLGAGIIAYEAALLHNQGATDEEVVSFVNKFKTKIGAYFIVDSLNYLKRGGRISGAQAAIGTMLGVKPIIKVTDEGKIVNDSKVTGRKKAILELVEKVKQLGDNVTDYPIGILHANCENDAKFLQDKLEELLGSNAKFWLQPIGPTVGTHCGPGTLGLIFHKK